MQIKILFDKDALDKGFHPALAGKRKVYTGWGVSFLVDDRILFDTGEKGQWLLENMKTFGVDAAGIETVVISHDHWDHWGGLWEILRIRKGIKVYACPHFSKGFKNKVNKRGGELIEADKFARVSKDVFISGEIAGVYKGRHISEQALAVRTEKGISVMTGCAHPGIVKMVEKTAQQFPRKNIFAVLGGFHLMKENRRTIESVVDNFKRIGVKKVGPTHCSGEIAEKIFKGRYKDNFIPVRAGKTIEV